MIRAGPRTSGEESTSGGGGGGLEGNLDVAACRADLLYHKGHYQARSGGSLSLPACLPPCLPAWPCARDSTRRGRGGLPVLAALEASLASRPTLPLSPARLTSATGGVRAVPSVPGQGPAAPPAAAAFPGRLPGAAAGRGALRTGAPDGRRGPGLGAVVVRRWHVLHGRAAVRERPQVPPQGHPDQPEGASSAALCVCLFNSSGPEGG